MNPLIYIILVSMLPIVELRAGIPLAIGLGFSVLEAFLICTIANILIIPIIFFFLDHLHKYFMRLDFYAKLFNRYLDRVRRKSEKKIKTWQYFALMAFVGIPFPGTGVYTGTLIAWFFNMHRKESIIVIGAGTVIAGVLASLASAGIFSLF